MAKFNVSIESKSNWSRKSIPGSTVAGSTSGAISVTSSSTRAANAWRSIELTSQFRGSGHFLCNARQELRTQAAVGHAVVGAERQRHDGDRLDAAVDHPRPHDDRSRADDSDLRWLDDGKYGVHRRVAQARQDDRRRRKLARPQSASARPHHE